MDKFIYLTFLLSAVQLDAMPTGTESTTTTPVMNDAMAMGYLAQYQYLGEGNPDPEIASQVDAEFYSMALMNFQTFSGLNATGVLDEATIEMMGKPRCGVPDILTAEDNGMSMDSKRKKRYTHEGGQWRKTSLTYRIERYSRKMDRQDVDSEMRKAFSVWEMVTPLRFTQQQDNPSVDIVILFAEREHGDGYPFDGRGRTLAHAFFPRYGGDCHFDEAETWTINTYRGTNFFQVAAHEIGHSLGLGHSTVQQALMAPFYNGYDPDFKLDQDDIYGIQSLYGRPVVGQRTTTTTTTTRRTPRPGNTMPPTRPPPTTTTESMPVPDLRKVCDAGQFDAITQTEENGIVKTYAFYQNLYMQLLDDGIAPGYPKQINEGWPGLDNNIDAAIYFKASYSTYWTWNNRRNEWELKTVKSSPSRTYFFKGGLYWRADDGVMREGYPKSIARYWGGLPNDLDAAYIWSRNGRAYFVKGDQYYRFGNNGVDRGYPRPFSVWTDRLDTIDSAVQWGAKTYFFKGSQYYRYNDDNTRIDSGYPKDTSTEWLGCQRFSNALSNADDISASSHNKPQNAYFHVTLCFVSLLYLYLNL